MARDSTGLATADPRGLPRAVARRPRPRAGARVLLAGDRSSACSSRRWPCAASGGSSALAGDDGGARRRSATPARTSCRPGEGCGAFAETAVRERLADDHRRGARGRRALGGGAARACRGRARTGRASPSTRSTEPPPPGDTGLRAATLADLDLLLPACAAAHERGARHRPAARDEDGFRWRDAQPDRGGPLVALGRGRRDPLQGRGVGLDAGRGAGAAGLGRPRGARPRLRAARPARPLPAAARARRRS